MLKRPSSVVRAIGKVIELTTSIDTLDVHLARKANLSAADDTARTIAKALAHNRSITCLDMTKTDLGDTAGPEFAEVCALC
jgi:hypothetical protein